MNADLEAAILDLPLVDYAAGEVVVAEGRKPEGLFFLASGSVEVFKGATRVARESEPGAVFGEMAALLDSVATATVRARQDSRFHIARNAAEFFTAQPKVGFHLARLLALRLETITLYVADVKAQFKDHAAHLGMVDDVVESLLARQPRHVERRNRGH